MTDPHAENSAVTGVAAGAGGAGAGSATALAGLSDPTSALGKALIVASPFVTLGTRWAVVLVDEAVRQRLRHLRRRLAANKLREAIGDPETPPERRDIYRTALGELQHDEIMESVRRINATLGATVAGDEMTASEHQPPA